MTSRVDWPFLSRAGLVGYEREIEVLAAKIWSRMATMGTVARELAAGLAGVAVMTAEEKLEQAFTRRPNSLVPARTPERGLRLRKKPDEERLLLSWAVHYGQGALLGTVHAVMTKKGFRGPVGSFMLLNLRLVNGQTLENVTGVGALPWTWPVDEQAVDLLHKAVYAFATGAFVDRLVPGPAGVPELRKRWTAR